MVAQDIRRAFIFICDFSICQYLFLIFASDFEETVTLTCSLCVVKFVSAITKITFASLFQYNYIFVIFAWLFFEIC